MVLLKQRRSTVLWLQESDGEVKREGQMPCDLIKARTRASGKLKARPGGNKDVDTIDNDTATCRATTSSSSHKVQYCHQMPDDTTTERSPALNDEDGSWNTWLIFRRLDREQQFWSSHVRCSLLRYDSAGCLLGMIHALCLWVRFGFAGKLASPYFPVDCCAVIACYGWVAWHACTQAQFYALHRPLVISTLRIMVHICFTFYLPSTAPYESPMAFLGNVLANSTASQLLYLGVMLPLQFRQHLLFCCLALPISIQFGCSRYCDMGYEAGMAPLVFGPIGNAIDAGMLVVAGAGWKGAGSCLGEAIHPCCLVVSFLHAFEGCVLSSGIVYCMEYRARLSFLRAEGSRSRIDRKWKFTEMIAIICWVSVVASCALWACMRMAAAGLESIMSCA